MPFSLCPSQTFWEQTQHTALAQGQSKNKPSYLISGESEQAALAVFGLLLLGSICAAYQVGRADSEVHIAPP